MISCDVLIVGGGPSAAREAQRIATSGRSVAVVAPQWGGCMRMLGFHLLQSYIEELDLRVGGINLERFVKDAKICPTGEEFADYVAAALSASGGEQFTGVVHSLGGRNGQFWSLASINDGKDVEFTSRAVVIASGLKPRALPERFADLEIRTCFDAYWDLCGSTPGTRFQGKDVLVLGNGNSAFQLALLASRRARSVTILGKKYPGVFPQETSDRFALRGLSQLAIERIFKSRMPATIAGGPAYYLSATPPLKLMSFYVGDDSCLAISKNELRLTVMRSAQRPWLSEACVDRDIESGLLEQKSTTQGGDTTLVRRFDIQNTVAISAIGTAPSLPTTEWRLLGSTGSVNHVQGRTPQEGVYVAGACAGYRSINEMVTPAYEKWTTTTGGA
jgi:siroheme synthase (precorrin-2 oxidase/ferrochelatase)